MQSNKRNPVDPTGILRSHPALRAALVALVAVIALGAFAWGLKMGFDRSREAVVPIPSGPLSSPAAPATGETAPKPAQVTAAGPSPTRQTPGAVASKPAAPKPQPQAQPASMAWPYQGGILKAFGWTYSQTMEDWRFHQGMDIAGNEGDEVVAAMAGKVESVTDTAMYGVRIVIAGQAGVKAVYSGCRDVLVKEGDTVRASQAVASIGRGAFECLDPAHLHFEVITDKGPVDPSQFLR